MNCHPKQFVASIAKKYNLDNVSAEFFLNVFEKYNGVDSYTYEAFDAFINDKQESKLFYVENKNDFENLNSFYEKYNGEIITNNILDKDYNTIINTFGSDNVLKWTDNNGNTHIKLNQPSQDEKLKIKFHINQNITQQQKEQIAQRINDIIKYNVNTINLIGSKKTNVARGDKLGSIHDNFNRYGIDFKASKKTKNGVDEYFIKDPSSIKIINWQNLKNSSDKLSWLNEVFPNISFMNNKLNDNITPNDEISNYLVSSQPDIFELFNDTEEYRKENAIHTVAGEILGYIKNKKAYINKDKFNPNTIVHEYTHLWCDAVMLKNPKLWKSIKDVLINNSEANKIKEALLNSEEYKDLKNDEDALTGEIIARLSGNQNRQYLESIQKVVSKGTFAKIMDSLKKFWRWIGKNLFQMEKVDTIYDVTDRILYDLINKTNLNEEIKSQPSIEQEVFNDPDYSALIDRKVYLDDNSIDAKLHKWKNVTTISASDKQRLSENIMQNISNFISAILEKPDLITSFDLIKDNAEREQVIKDISENKYSRKDVINKIGFSTFVNTLKERFLNNTSWHTDEIRDNWDAILYNGNNILYASEGFKLNAVGQLELVKEQIYDLDSIHNEEDQETELEGWQIDNDQRSVIDSLTDEIRNVIYTIPISGQRTEWGLTRFESGFDIAKSILRMCSNRRDYNSFKEALLAQKDVYKWIMPLLYRIENTPNLRQRIFRNFRKAFVKRVIFVYDENTKQLKPTILNYESDVTSVKMKNIENTWNNDINSKYVTLVSKGNETSKYSTDKNINNIKTDIDNINRILAQQYFTSNDIFIVKDITKNLGFNIDNDIIDNILNNKTLYVKFLGGLDSILKILSNIKNSHVNPISTNVNSLNISGYIKNILEIEKIYEPSYQEDSTIEKNKNYYAYVYPSFFTDLMDLLKNSDNLNDEEYEKLIKEIYNDDYLLNSNGEFRNEILRSLCDRSDDLRNIFDNISILNDKKIEIKDMNKSHRFECQMSAFLNTIGKKGSYSRYVCGVFSNKEQMQFVTLRNYDYNELKDKYYNVLVQELDRIRDVVLRARNKNVVRVDNYDISSKDLSKVKDRINGKLTADDFKAIKKSGAVFKHLLFLNEALFDENNSFGKTLRNAINNNDRTNLESDFTEVFGRINDKDSNSLFVKYFNSEYDAVKDLIPLNSDNNNEPIWNEETVKKFIYNDFYAQIQLSQLFQIDTAYNKNAGDSQKRAAAFIAPGLKLDVNATFIDETTQKEIRYADENATMRTVVIKAEKVISDSISVLDNIFDRKIAEFGSSKTAQQFEAFKKVLKTRLLKTYSKVNGKGGFDPADAQSWMSPTSFWKKLGMEGEDTKEIKEIINQISQGNLNVDYLRTILGQPQKPVVYGFQHMNYATTTGGLFTSKCLPTYIKDSEITLILTDAIIRGSKENSILTGLFDLMEDSHYRDIKSKNGKTIRSGYKQNGIDNITMSSAVKLGLQGTIDLSEEAITKYQNKYKCSKAEAVKGLISSKIYKKDGTYDNRYVIETSFNDYRIQQEVPPHLRNHEQQEGSQKRVLDIVDIKSDDFFRLKDENGKYGDYTGIELQEEYLNLSAKYFSLAKKDIEAKFGLTNEARKKYLNGIIKNLKNKEDKSQYVFDELFKQCLNNKMSILNAFGINDFNLLKDIKDTRGKNLSGLFKQILSLKENEILPESATEVTVSEKKMILSEILKQQIESDSRYDRELLYAVSINPQTGDFNVPLSDHINFFRIEQLINSIVKKGFNKQMINGGPIVQASSYGFDDKLAVRFKYFENGKWKLLKTFKEFGGSIDEYKQYIADKNAVLLHHEICITPPWGEEITSRLIITEDNIDDLGGDRSRLGSYMTPIEAIRLGIITEDMLYAIGNRIPTENKSSIYPMKVVGFVPEGVGTCIMLPEEIVAITGSDFDIDKTFIRFKHFNGKEEIKDLDTKEGINNKLFDIDMAIYSHPSMQFLMFNPQGFENTKQAGKIALIGASEVFKINKKTNKKEYYSLQELENMSVDELEDIIETNDLSDDNKNIHSLSTQLEFFEKNIEGAQLLGMFANNNTAHAFCQLHNQFLKDSGISPMWIRLNEVIKLDGVLFGPGHNSLNVDGILNRNGDYYISSSTGEFVGAAADVAKDDVLGDFNANRKTIDLIELLIRCGFNHEYVGLFINQPIIKQAVRSGDFKKGLESSIEAINDKFKKEGYTITNPFNMDKEDLFNYLNKKKHLKNLNKYYEFQYHVASTAYELLKPSQDLLRLSLECRYNSIKNGCGPTILDNFISRERHESFVNDTNNTIMNSNNIVENNPLLNILYKEQFDKGSLLERILSNDTVEYSQGFQDLYDAWKSLGKSAHYDSDEFFKLFNDWNLYRLTVNEKWNPSFLNSNEVNRKKWYEFPKTLNEIKKIANEEDLNNSFIKLLYIDELGNLCINTKKIKGEKLDLLKADIEALLYSKNEKLSKFAKDSFYYFLYKNGFNFNAYGDTQMYPVALRNQIGFYDFTRDPNYNSNNQQLNFIRQFYRNHPEFCYPISLNYNNNTIDTQKGDLEFKETTIKINNKSYDAIEIEPNDDNKFDGLYFNKKYRSYLTTFEYTPNGEMDFGEDIYMLYNYSNIRLVYIKMPKLGNQYIKEYEGNTNALEVNPINKDKDFINPFNDSYDIDKANLTDFQKEFLKNQKKNHNTEQLLNMLNWNNYDSPLPNLIASEHINDQLKLAIRKMFKKEVIDERFNSNNQQQTPKNYDSNNDNYKPLEFEEDNIEFHIPIDNSNSYEQDDIDKRNSNTQKYLKTFTVKLNEVPAEIIGAINSEDNNVIQEIYDNFETRFNAETTGLNNEKLASIKQLLNNILTDKGFTNNTNIC